MIANDQPTSFDSTKISVNLSSYDDGNMSFSTGNTDDITENRQLFLENLGVDPLQTALVQVTYDTTDFTRYDVVDEDQLGEGMLSPVVTHSADALVATRPGQALFLPLADCAGAVLYDSKSCVLMMSHLGRHSVEADGAAASVRFLVEEFDSNPADIQVWLSPAVGAESYPVDAFDGRSLHEIIVEQLVSADVSIENIEVNDINTAASNDYYSHSEFLAGERSEDGRFAIVAVMHE